MDLEAVEHAYKYQKKFAKQTYRLKYETRAQASLIVLKQVVITSILIFVLRLRFLKDVSKIWSLTISMTTIFVSVMEAQTERNINMPAIYIQIASFFKVIKAVATIATFTMNNSINDFFICYFFFATSVCGTIFFNYCGFERPKHTGAENFR